MIQATTDRAAAEGDHPGGAADAPPVKRVIPAIDVDAILFRAANEFTSDEDTRYYLQGVYVQPHPDKGALLVATDGHRLIGIHDETGQCSAAAIVMVTARAFAGVKIDKKKPLERPRLKLDVDGHVIVGTYRSLEFSIIDGTFPAYSQVLKPVVKALKKGTYAPASFNHNYLAAFSRAAALITSGSNGVRLISTAENDAALILFEGCAHAFGILMPMRTSVQNGMPAFMRPVLEPPPAPPPPVAKVPLPRGRKSRKQSGRYRKRNRAPQRSVAAPEASGDH